MQRLLRERLDSNYGLSFGLVAHGSQSDVCALSATTGLQDLVAAGEQRWHTARLPVYLDDGDCGQGAHVADVTVTVIAQRALQQLCRSGRGAG